MAGLKPLPPAEVETYQDAELLRQKPWLWRACPVLMDGTYVRLMGGALMIFGIVLIILAFSDPHESLVPAILMLRIGLTMLGLLSLWACRALFKQHSRGCWLRWQWKSVEGYEEEHGPMPQRAYEMMGAIRKVTLEGEFRVKVVGDDPILNFGDRRREFEPRENHDLLIWDADGNIILPPA